MNISKIVQVSRGIHRIVHKYISTKPLLEGQSDTLVKSLKDCRKLWLEQHIKFKERSGDGEKRNKNRRELSKSKKIKGKWKKNKIRGNFLSLKALPTKLLQGMNHISKYFLYQMKTLQDPRDNNFNMKDDLN